MTLQWSKIVVGCAALLVALIGAGIVWHIKTDQPSLFPKTIQKEAAFIIFYPDEVNTGYKINSESIKYSSKDKVLSFTVQKTDNKIVFTEQATPDQFNDIPQYWTAFTDKLNGYKSFDSENGKVALTRPAELQGGQSAVFNGKGTLMFLHPDHDMDDDSWRKLFNSLKQQ